MAPALNLSLKKMVAYKVSSCKFESGSVDQESQMYLDNDQVMEDMFLSCVTYPTSDVEMTADIPPAIR